MRLISRLFRAKSDLEEELERIYVQMFQTAEGMSFSEARDTVRMMLKDAKQDSEKEGTAQLPQNFGDILLEKESTDKGVKSMLTKLRRESVRDDDIKFWWNQHDLERRMMQQEDFMSRFSLFLKFRDEGLSPKEASKRVAKRFPIFGEPEDATLGNGEDRPLPYELKDRINIWIQKRQRMDPEQFKKSIEYSTSVNSLIRKEIKKGNI